LPLLGYEGNPKLSSASVREETGMTRGGIYKWEGIWEKQQKEITV
jgi:hypothetical protein